MLTELEVSRIWRALFAQPLGDDTFTKAENLLEELRAESPLRHRLSTELEELRSKASGEKKPTAAAKRKKVSAR